MDKEQLDRAIDHVTRLIGEESGPSNLGSLTYTLSSLMKLYEGTEGPQPDPPPDTWISVEERLPDNGMAVLISRMSGNQQVGYYGGPPIGGRCPWRLKRHGDGFFDITHWRPLPEPPGEG